MKKSSHNCIIVGTGTEKCYSYKDWWPAKKRYMG